MGRDGRTLTPTLSRGEREKMAPLPSGSPGRKRHQIGKAVVPFTRSIAKRPVTFRSAGTAATKRR